MELSAVFFITWPRVDVVPTGFTVILAGGNNLSADGTLTRVSAIRMDVSAGHNVVLM